MISLGIKKPITTLMLVLGTVLVASISLWRMPVELYPNYEFGEVTVITHLRGGVPATVVEKTVTKQFEEAFSDINGLKEILSASRESESVVMLKFRQGVNLNFVVLDVREKIATIQYKLPREAEKPVIAKFQQFDIPIMILSLSSQELSAEKMREIADDQIKEKMLRITGVANIEVGGGRERKILIEINNSRLLSYNLPIMNVVEMINLSNISVSAGDIEKINNKYVVRVTGIYKDIEEIANTGIATTPSGSVIRLKDIAEVKDSYYEPTSFSRMNVEPVVSVYFQKESAANTITVSKNILKQVEEMRELLNKKKINITVVKNDADYIQKAISSLRTSLIYGAILVTIVLFFFIRDIRGIMIIIFTIPISLCLAFVLMYVSKLTINIMTLSGLSLGVGMLVSNGILILENVALKYTKDKNMDKETLVIEGTKELFMPICASTLTTVIVFLPLAFIEQEVRRLYVPFGLAITFSLFAALLGSLLLMPPMILRWHESQTTHKWKWYKKFNIFFLHSLNFMFRKQYYVLMIILVLFGLSIFVFITRESEFIDSSEANTFRIGLQFPPGTRIERSNEIVKRLEKSLIKYPIVERVSSKVEKLHTFVEVKVKKEREKFKKTFRAKFNEFSPAFIYYQESQEMSSKEVLLDLFGFDYAILTKIAFAASGRMAKIPNLSDVKIRMREDEPELNVNVDHKRMAILGLNTYFVANSLHNMLRGLVATHYRTEGKEIETIARLIPGTVRSAAELPFLSFCTPKGDIITIGQVSDVQKVTTQQEIWRKNKKRFVQISATREKIGLTGAVDKIKQVLTGIKFPADYSYNFSGDYEKTVKNRKQFLFALFLTIFLIYLTIASFFESYLQPLLIMFTLPLSILGVAFLLFVLKKSISLGVWIGLMLLGGVVVNNAIVLVNKINTYRTMFHLKKSLLSSVIYGSNDTLREILMTSLTTIFGVIPLILNQDETAEMWRTLGLTMFGGMITATILTLYVVPIGFILIENSREKIKTKIHNLNINISKKLIFKKFFHRNTIKV